MHHGHRQRRIVRQRKGKRRAWRCSEDEDGGGDAGCGRRAPGSERERAQVEGGSSRRKEPTMKQHVHARPHQREANSIAIFRSRQGHKSPRLLLAQDTCTAGISSPSQAALDSATSERCRRAAISSYLSKCFGWNHQVPLFERRAASDRTPVLCLRSC